MTERIPLPVCRWRGDQPEPGYWECFSPKIVIRAGPGVPEDLCRKCYLCNHPAEPPTLLARPQPGAGRCKHLSKRVRHTDGTVKMKRCYG